MLESVDTSTGVMDQAAAFGHRWAVCVEVTGDNPTAAVYSPPQEDGFNFDFIIVLSSGFLGGPIVPPC